MVRQRSPPRTDALLFLDSRSCARRPLATQLLRMGRVRGHPSRCNWTKASDSDRDVNGLIDLLPQVDREAMAGRLSNCSPTSHHR